MQPVALGTSHQAWVQKMSGAVPISRELSQWTEALHRIAMGGSIPWADINGGPARRPQTIVFGGFSDIMRMIYFEGEQETKTKSGNVDTQAAWGYLLRHVTTFFHLVNSLPFHIIIELGANNVTSDNPKDRGAVIGYTPDIQGKSRSVIGRMVHAMLFQEKAGTMFRAWFQKSSVQTPVIRHMAIAAIPQMVGSPYVENLSYDHFAQALGLPPIMAVDPQHPRCIPGRWPWPASHWCAQ